jgi:hypothetical protein
MSERANDLSTGLSEGGVHLLVDAAELRQRAERASHARRPRHSRRRQQRRHRRARRAPPAHQRRLLLRRSRRRGSLGVGAWHGLAVAAAREAGRFYGGCRPAAAVGECLAWRQGRAQVSLGGGACLGEGLGEVVEDDSLVGGPTVGAAVGLRGLREFALGRALILTAGKGEWCEKVSKNSPGIKQSGPAWVEQERSVEGDDGSPSVHGDRKERYRFLKEFIGSRINQAVGLDNIGSSDTLGDCPQIMNMTVCLVSRKEGRKEVAVAIYSLYIDRVRHNKSSFCFSN